MCASRRAVKVSVCAVRCPTIPVVRSHGIDAPSAPTLAGLPACESRAMAVGCCLEVTGAVSSVAGSEPAAPSPSSLGRSCKVYGCLFGLYDMGSSGGPHWYGGGI